MTTEEYIEKAKLVHGDLYTYDDTFYAHRLSPLQITCSIHGNFTKAPRNHLQGQGCPSCSKEKKIANMKLTQEQFLEKVTRLHGTKYDYSDTVFTATKDKITYKCLTCNTLVEQKAAAHIRGEGCSTCGQASRIQKIRYSYEEILAKSKDIHNNKYTYPESNKTHYVDTSSNIIVTCPIHGQFEVNTYRHIHPTRKQGCNKCRVAALIAAGKMPGGYCKEVFEANEVLQNTEGTLYYLQIGNIYKIGITTNLKDRLTSLKTKAKKDIQVLLTKTGPLYSMYKYEQQVLQLCKANRITTEWSTELFNKDIIETIKGHINETT